MLHSKKTAAAGLLAVALAAGAGASARIARAQQNQAAGDVEILTVRPNIYLLAGAGGNIVVQTGPDGVFVVDSGTAAMADRVLEAIKKLSDQPIRYIINTSADADHVGGNAKLSAAGRTLLPLADTVGADLANIMTAGGVAPILAHEHVLLRMSAPTGQQSPFPSAAWPTDTFSQKRKALYLNSEAVEVLYQPAAHTDGDSFVFFRRSDVVAAGEILNTTRFPVIDVPSGGTIQGELDALNRLVELVVPPVPFVWREGGTYAIPGHGRICEQSDVVEYRDMVTIIRDTIRDMARQGMTLEQVKAADPAKAYPQYGPPAAFIEAIYKTLPRKNP